VQFTPLLCLLLAGVFGIAIFVKDQQNDFCRLMPRRVCKFGQN